MARQPRVVVPGVPMHIIQRGNNCSATFFADNDYYLYLNTLAEAALEYGCRLHTYVLMTNHVHLLVTPASHDSVALMMQAIGRKYVRYINNVYQRTGTLWEGRYKSALVDSDNYLLTCSRYIELNPVRAHMVDAPGQYRWSSYRANALGKFDRYVLPHSLYINLGATDTERQAAYRSLFELHISKSVLRAIRENTQQCTLIGDTRFQEEIQAMLKRRVMKLEHGGDRKSDGFIDKSSTESSGLTPCFFSNKCALTPCFSI